jgi:hypothetical protein
MGHPVTRVEVIGKDGQQLQSLSSDLFGWEIDAHNRRPTASCGVRQT